MTKKMFSWTLTIVLVSLAVCASAQKKAQKNDQQNAQEKELKWWKSLPNEWQESFRAVLNKRNIDAQDVQTLWNRKRLDLEGQHDLVGFEPLKAFKNLEILNLCDTELDDLRCIKNNAKLKELRLRRTKLSNIDLLASFPNLEKL